MEENSLVHLVLGPLMLVLSLIFKFFPPKEINDFYGYRTKRSKKSQEAWDVANAYSFNLMIIASLSTIILQLILILTVSKDNSIMISAAGLVMFLVGTIPLTEMHLKKHFDENGNRKSVI